VVQWETKISVFILFIGHQFVQYLNSLKIKHSTTNIILSNLLFLNKSIAQW
jgi:hypothetical protein